MAKTRKSVVMKIEGKAFIITVKVFGVLSNKDDICSKPEGSYLVFADDTEDALDQFHLQIPIGCLDDYDIYVHDVSQL